MAATPELYKALELHISGTGMVIENELPKGYLSSKKRMNGKARNLTTTKRRLIDQVPERAKGYVMEMTNALLALNYGVSTLKVYTGAFINFLRYHGYRDPSTIERSEVLAYLAMFAERGLKSNSQHNAINGLKFYCKHVLQWSDTNWNIPRPKREKTIPIVLSKEECQRVFAAVKNAKHKLILLMTYGCGLRVSETINLRWEHIDFEEHKILIKQAKGKKDRFVMLPVSIVEYIESYKELYGGEGYVFKGQIAGEPYSAGSVQAIMRRARENAGIGKRATTHSLRHSFATHLIESGTDIRFIQTLLGHQSIKTTTIYTHITGQAEKKIASPLDQLQITPHPEPPKNPKK